MLLGEEGVGGDPMHVMLSGASSCKQRALSTVLECRQGFALWLWPSGCGFSILHQRLGIFFSPAFVSSPLSTCDAPPLLLLLAIRRVMEVPLTFPPSSYVTQVFGRGFQTPSASSPLRMMLAKRGRGAALTSQAAGA